jgi:putative ABC transport system substrate-binding protein
MMSRRRFLIAGALSALNVGYATAQPRPVKIGMLGPVVAAKSVYIPGVVRALAELGYREGPDTVLEHRSAEGSADRYPGLARELINARCDVIFAFGTEPAVRALQDARAPMPVVFLAVDYDPLEKGIVASLTRPDRNTTGVYVPQHALVAKRVQILREIVPAARHFLVLADTFSKNQVDAARRAADSVGMQLTVIEFSKPPYDYAGAFEAGRKDEVQGFVTLASPVFAFDRAQLAALLSRHRLPAIGSTSAQADAGFLLSFGTSVTKVTRRVAEVGVRILKGAKPADIPIEQADEFELAVNSKTARALGVRIPESVLARATRIVT